MSSRQTSVHWYILNTYLQQLANWKRDINTFTPTTQVQVALNTFQCSQAPKQQNNMELTQCTFHSQAQKIKKTHPERNYLFFRKWNFLVIILCSFLYFLKRKLFYILENKKPEKCFVFQETELSYISGGICIDPKAKMFSISPKTL